MGGVPRFLVVLLLVFCVLLLLLLLLLLMMILMWLSLWLHCCCCCSNSPGTNLKQVEKNKKILSVQKWELERSGEDSCGFKDKNDQELHVDTVGTTLITQKSIVSQSVSYKQGCGPEIQLDI